MLKEAYVIKSRRARGAGLTITPVLLFVLLPSDKLELYESLLVELLTFGKRDIPLYE